MNNPAFPNAGIATGRWGLPTRGAAREKFPARFVLHNPLKSLVSDERIQGKPRKSNSENPWFSRLTGRFQEIPN
jgi:hypothetical protein